MSENERMREYDRVLQLQDAAIQALACLATVNHVLQEWRSAGSVSGPELLALEQFLQERRARLDPQITRPVHGA